MKLVGSYSKPEQAHMTRSLLEGNGIAAFVRDDNTVTADWFLSNAIGGVKVEVADDDHDAARSILEAQAPPPNPAVETGAKKGRPANRYMKIFAAAFVVIFGFLAWRWQASDPSAIVMTAVESLMLSPLYRRFLRLA